MTTNSPSEEIIIPSVFETTFPPKFVEEQPVAKLPSLEECLARPTHIDETLGVARHVLTLSERLQIKKSCIEAKPIAKSCYSPGWTVPEYDNLQSMDLDAEPRKEDEDIDPFTGLPYH